MLTPLKLAIGVTLPGNEQFQYSLSSSQKSISPSFSHCIVPSVDTFTPSELPKTVFIDL